MTFKQRFQRHPLRFKHLLFNYAALNNLPRGGAAASFGGTRAVGRGGGALGGRAFTESRRMLPAVASPLG